MESGVRSHDIKIERLRPVFDPFDEADMSTLSSERDPKVIIAVYCMSLIAE